MRRIPARSRPFRASGALGLLLVVSWSFPAVAQECDVDVVECLVTQPNSACICWNLRCEGGGTPGADCEKDGDCSGGQCNGVCRDPVYLGQTCRFEEPNDCDTDVGPKGYANRFAKYLANIDCGTDSITELSARRGTGTVELDIVSPAGSWVASEANYRLSGSSTSSLTYTVRLTGGNAETVKPQAVGAFISDDGDEVPTVLDSVSALSVRSWIVLVGLLLLVISLKVLSRRRRTLGAG